MKDFDKYIAFSKKRQSNLFKNLDFKISRIIEKFYLHFLGKLYNHKLLKSKEFVILNIGSGYTSFQNTIQCDLMPSLIKLVLGKSKFPDLIVNLYFHQKSLQESADAIYLSHVLEHIEPTQIDEVLKNLYKYLKPGGHLRILVPNYKVYLQNTVENSPQGFKSGTLSLNRLFYHWGHRFMYDENIFTEILTRNGFDTPSFVKWKEGYLGEFDVQEREFESLCVLVRKA